jgi:hypothetical protein
MNTDLTEAQEDYAHFLPALSGFYATYIGKQRYPDPVKGLYVDDNRMPNNFANGMESLNYLNAKEGAFTYKWTLYSAGHAELDTTKHSPKVSKLVKEFGKAIGKILIVLKHKRSVTECYVGWMLIWTMV